MNRIQKEGLWRQIQAAGDDVESITSVLNNPNIQNLRTSINQLAQDKSRATERYGEKHPEYQKAVTALANAEAQLQAEIRKAVQNAKNEFDNAVQQEREMQGQLNESKRQATALGRKGVDYSVLLREAESNRAIYNQLLTREKELRVVANSRTNNVRVVDRAEVPGAPFSPNHRRDWVYAIALGLALGLGLAFGIDYLDDTVKTPDDVTRRLKLQVPRPGADRLRRSPSADLRPGAARFRRSLSLDPHRARRAAARQRRRASSPWPARSRSKARRRRRSTSRWRWPSAARACC